MRVSRLAVHLPLSTFLFDYAMLVSSYALIRPVFSQGRLGGDVVREKREELRALPNGEDPGDRPGLFGEGETPSEMRRILLLLAAGSAVAGSGSLRSALASEPPKSWLDVESSNARPESREVLKAPLDNRSYEYLTLPNDLRVVLVSDPSSSEVAVAMDVHVGACSDPLEVPGLAHFNEHMLFLGTKKYPDENSFETFLSQSGGQSNAYTDTEDTVYYFEMSNSGKLEESLKRFGSFFDGPLFTSSSTERELNAIESENAKNLQSDGFRLYQIEKGRANPDHPFSKFFTGNRKTLLVDTKERGINLRDQLLQFWEKYYSSNQMTLAVVAPQSLAQLKPLVKAAFSDIPNRKANPPEDQWVRSVPPFSDNSSIPGMGSLLEVVPVSDSRVLTMVWPIVYASQEEVEVFRFENPLAYVSHVLGHEGPNSLLSYLKNQGWANSLSSSIPTNLADFVTIEITVSLTVEGLNNLNKVVESIFTLLKIMNDRGLPNYLFEEVLNLNELGWRFRTKERPGAYAQSIATAMQEFPPALVVAGPSRLALRNQDYQLIQTSTPRTQFDTPLQLEISKTATKDLLSRLIQVDNVLLTVASKTFVGKTDKKEFWYGTDYKATTLSNQITNKWSNPTQGAKQLDLPPRNAFIPSEAGLVVKKYVDRTKLDKPLSFQDRFVAPTKPLLIQSDDRWNVYYKQDDRFGEPTAYVIVELLTKSLHQSPQDAILASFTEISVADGLREYTYDATLAGLAYAVSIGPRGIRITFQGYNDKLDDFIRYVTDKFTRGMDDLLPQTNAQFDRYKDTIQRSLKGFDVKQPYSQAIYYSALLQSPPKYSFSNAELRQAADKTTLSKLRTYAQSVFKTGKGQALVQGNLDSAQAQKIISNLDESLAFAATSDVPEPTYMLPLPLSPTRLTVACPNRDNKNSVSQIVIQSLGTTDKDHVLIEVLVSVLQEPFYDQLRTKKQLGYIVNAGVKAIGDARSLSLLVQSSVQPVDVLTREIFLFLDQFKEKTLAKINGGDFQQYAKSLIERKTERDKTLPQEVTQNWPEITSRRLRFSRRIEEAEALLELNRDDLILFWDRVVSNDAPGRRLLVSEIVPQDGPASSPPPSKSYQPLSAQEPNAAESRPFQAARIGIDDVDAYRKSMQSSVEEKV